MYISYAITVCNEEKEIKQLLDFIIKYKRSEDEICVLVDKPKANLFLLDKLYKYASNDHILLRESAFLGDFSEWKNELNRMCKGDYIFNIDADEIPDEYLMLFLPDILQSNNVDLIKVPRINTVEGITQEHIDKWRWEVNKEGYVNFPDYQSRIYRNSPNIKWVGKVHEHVRGYLTKALLPDLSYYCLYHPKTIEKQEKQNKFYEEI
jgi:hypothetical protein